MKISQFFKEDNGMYSNARLLAFTSVCSFIIDWQHHIWTGLEFNPAPSIVAFVLGIVAAKIIQKPFEQNLNLGGQS